MTKREQKQTKIRIDTDLALALVVLLASVPRLASAFSRADPDLLGIPIAPWTGVGTAVVFELGIYYMAKTALVAWRKNYKLPKSMGEFKLWKLLPPFILFELVVAPIIALPAGLSVVRGHTIAEVLGSWDWPWMLVAYAAPSVLVAGVAVAGAIERRDWTKKDTTPPGETAKKSKPIVTPNTCTVEGCEKYGVDFGTQRAYAGHCGGAAHKTARETRDGKQGAK